MKFAGMNLMLRDRHLCQNGRCLPGLLWKASFAEHIWISDLVVYKCEGKSKSYLFYTLFLLLWWTHLWFLLILCLWCTRSESYHHGWYLILTMEKKTGSSGQPELQHLRKLMPHLPPFFPSPPMSGQWSQITLECLHVRELQSLEKEVAFACARPGILRTFVICVLQISFKFLSPISFFCDTGYWTQNFYMGLHLQSYSLWDWVSLGC